MRTKETPLPRHMHFLKTAGYHTDYTKLTLLFQVESNQNPRNLILMRQTTNKTKSKDKSLPTQPKARGENPKGKGEVV